MGARGGRWSHLPDNMSVGMNTAFACVLALAATMPASGAPGVHPSSGIGACPSLSQQKDEPPKASVLDDLLAKTAEYAARLESSVLDFVCREEIRETTDFSFDLVAKGAASGFYPLALALRDSGLAGPKVSHSYVYDYQCLRSGAEIREVRRLLKEDGAAKNKPNSVLETSVVVFETALMWPVGVFSERYQTDYDYVLVARDRVGGRPAVIIDVRPKPGAPEGRCPYGKVWLDAATADILRVDWNEGRVGGYNVFLERGNRYHRTPRLTIRSEFKAERNGLRFPSRLAVEEAYLAKSGQIFVRSETDVTYKHFKFFTVEVEVGR